MPGTTAGPCAPVTDRRGLSDIAYGFMASKALFAALELGLFTHLDAGPRDVANLSAATGVAPNRLRTLLHALAAVGLLVPDGPAYRNAPGPQRFLVRGAHGDIGEYYRLQIARQIYPALLHLDDGLAGTSTAFDTFGDLLSRPDEAATFTAAQHAGSLGAARALAGRVELGDARWLLDVGGGSGAFSIALCDTNPGLNATILDFPAVVELAAAYRRDAGLDDRMALLRGDAVHTPWPSGQDVVLLSYLLSALGEAEIGVVLGKARDCLRPGGLLVVHDFVLDEQPAGALWFLQYVAFRPDAVSFTAAELAGWIRDRGFTAPSCEVLVPGITRVLVARREALR
jgi:2-hydroxy-4-(methylsulfanyl)butanoate S-methyltransferase